MDSLSLIELATAIVLFTTFGQSLVSGNLKPPFSSSGLFSIGQSLTSIGDELKDFTKRFKVAKVQSEQPALSEEELVMLSIASTCDTLCSSLIKTVGFLKVKDSFVKHASLERALATAWKGKDVKEWDGRFRGVTSQLESCLGGILSNTRCAPRVKLVVALHDGNKEVQTNISDLVSAMPALLLAVEDVQRDQAILDSLRFPRMKARHARIPVAHRKTFDWIFSPSFEPSSNGLAFTEWLEKGDRLYWIWGKPGSGKSTLMKYLYGHDGTNQALRKWAGERELVVVQHYFWNSGSEIQKSHRGFLQSLLSDIFRQSPGVIRYMCPRRWQAVLSDLEPWTIPDLHAALSMIEELSRPPDGPKFCFFIDGLDEYNGDHSQLKAVITGLVSSPNVKMCVSSRPWPKIAEAFGTSKMPRLKLEDLSKGDITSFVENELECNDTFVQLRISDDRFNRLIGELADRAQGVFLWAALAVQDVNKSLTRADTFEDYDNQLKSIPVDLDEYFMSMLNSVDSKYHERTARILQVCYLAQEPLLVLALSFLNQPDMPLATADRSSYPSEEELIRHCSDAETEIRTACNDLLIIVQDDSIIMPRYVPKQRLEFTHRTVRDFIENPRTQTLLHERMTRSFPFIPQHYLCRSYLVQIKLLTFTSDEEALEILLARLMTHALLAERETHTADASLLDNLEAFGLSGRTYMTDFYGQRLGFWNLKMQKRWVLAVAAQFGLWRYIAHKLDAEPELLRRKIDERSLLTWALQPQFPGKKGEQGDPEVVRLLREREMALED